MSDTPNAPACRWPGAAADHSGFPDPDRDLAAGDAHSAEIVLAGGCFWCVDGVFRAVEGVLESECGYCGGAAETANYPRVCRGDTGHAEAVRLRYDPQRISLGALLKLFFSVAHDPTQRNRQGNDVGPQYRSAVFVADDQQRAVTEAYIAQLDAAGALDDPIVTTIEPLEAFHPAEPEHQNYAARNPGAGYVRVVARPKMDKLEKQFAGRVRG